MVTILGDPDGVPESRGGQSVRLFDTVRDLVAARVAAGGPELLPEIDPAAPQEAFGPWSDGTGVPESGARPRDVAAKIRAAFQHLSELPKKQFTTPPQYDAEYWEAIATMDAEMGAGERRAAQAGDKGFRRSVPVGLQVENWEPPRMDYEMRATDASAPDPAALLGPVREPVDWNPRDAAGDEEC